MARHPFLQLNYCANQDDIARKLNNFFKKEWEEPLPAFQKIKRNIDPQYVPFLSRIYAEALLFSSIIQPEKQISIPEELEDLSVFGEGTPSLKILLKTNSAVVHFPTCSENKPPEMWRLYIFQTVEKWEDCSHFLEHNQLIDPHTAVYFVNDSLQLPVQMLAGNSWQLAYRIAQHALEQGKTKKGLAFQYLFTGAVSANNINAVEVEKKLELLDRYERTLLYPASCNPEIPEKYTTKCHKVATVEQAWRIVSGLGVEKKSEIILPDELQFLNLLVGEAVLPVLSVILLLNPRSVILWCSNVTRKRAEIIRDALNSIPEFKSDIQIRMLDSHDLQTCYSTLRDAINKQGSSDTLISMTGGNRLMGIAAQLTAMEMNLKLIYRDIDAKPNTLTAIQFGNSNNYESGDVYIPSSRCPFSEKVQWENLFQKNQFKADSAEMLLKHFYKE